ncbi:methionine ABC transporter ATP-binding protein [Alsobacter sp. KACC 23698]|uniref:Cell division ATP-binding protein FtsE n=1 Tax=Alsobacter sp. KACC 23698 TaxID=3149229 RepID=A0AAU7JAH0_9HYPH
MNAPLRVAPSGPPLHELQPAAAAIRFEKASKVFGPRRGQPELTALDGIDLSVPKGSIMGVIGRSGAGKSTLIRLVNGLERTTGGAVWVDGVNVAGLDEASLRTVRRSVGMVFQHFNLLSSRTVFDNVALPLEIAGGDKAQARSAVERLLALVGLSDKRDRYPAELSGGQKQRVGIARALATDPSVLLCDEATSALDPETTSSILHLLGSLRDRLGLTILLITHEMQVIKEICDRVAVLEAGRIVEEGAVFDVLTKPRHPTTASFLASVTGVEPPPDIAQTLRPEAYPGGSAVVRITFTGENATSPVISRLTRVLGIDFNILAGRIERIAGRPYGRLLVSLPSDEPGLSASLSALARLELGSEVIGHVP